MQTPDALPITGADLAWGAEALLGTEWRHELARLLGGLHPDGPRAAIDIRMVRRWANGSRPIPAWVTHEVAALLRRHAQEMIAAASALTPAGDR